MHGIKRVKQTPEALEARKQKERAKIQEFTALSEDLLRRKKESDYSEDAFKLTTRLLHINPEFYTIWNYRRNILLKGLFTVSSLETVNRILTDELGMTMAALKSHPKVYWIWNHRRWCLENIPFGPGEEGTPSHNDWRNTAWNNELYVVEKLLDADARNFHAWDYRRYVLASMPVPRPELSELGYTSRKIGANFSNFSAWHQRSKVLPRLWEAGTLDEKTSRESGRVIYTAYLLALIARLLRCRIRIGAECDVYRTSRSECMGLSSVVGWIKSGQSFTAARDRSDQRASGGTA
ncbi:RAB-protein geranylgeranyltransferase, variant 3 [Coprinopsis cinerea AmutBmut pab1-1]|nr:RAB-protein geranylgeranyltransferase, variant 3 [Coprinopsis cinerea AmutBmut pab1-1]